MNHYSLKVGSIAAILSLMLCFGWIAAFAGQPRFIDRTAEMGLNGVNPHRKACWVDFNNNGWPDLIAGGKIFINKEGKGFARIVSGLGDVVAADFNNNGWVDLFSYSRMSLFLNSNGESVTEVQLPGFPEGYRSRGACWGDFNNNGFVDLYVGGYENWEEGITFPDYILLNVDGESFRIGWQEDRPGWRYRARGVTACDFNRNGAIDIYVSNYRLSQNLLWINDGNGVFRDMAGDYAAHGGGHKTELGGSAHTIGSVWGDFNNSGYFDLFVCNFAHPGQAESRFLKNTGSQGGYMFKDMGTSGIHWQESYATPVAGDLNNDGNLDLFLTTVYAVGSGGIRNFPALFINNGAFDFTDRTENSGLEELPPTYHAALADYNNNGYLDIFTAGKLFENEGGRNSYLKVKLLGDADEVNRSAIGAQVRIDLSGRTLSRQVEAGTGEGNQNELTLHFGLGQHESRVNLDIFWPDGREERMEDVGINQTLIIGRE